MPPVTFVPIPLSPLSVAATGEELASALPKITFLFLNSIVLSLVIEPETGLAGLAVTVDATVIVKLLAFEVALNTGHCPSRFVIPLLAMFRVSPALIPKVNGVYVNVSVVELVIVPTVSALK